LLLAAAHRIGAAGTRTVERGRAWSWGVLLTGAVALGFVPVVRDATPAARLAAVVAGSALLALTGWMALFPAEDRALVRATVQRFAFAGRPPA